jgi:hypothetical protein
MDRRAGLIPIYRFRIWYVYSNGMGRFSEAFNGGSIAAVCRDECPFTFLPPCRAKPHHLR